MAGGVVSPRLLEAGDAARAQRARRRARASEARADPRRARADALRRRRCTGARSRCSSASRSADDELTRLLAALDARAAAEGIDEQTGEQLLLRLRERGLQRELAEAGGDRLPDLQQALAQRARPHPGIRVIAARIPPV